MVTLCMFREVAVGLCVNTNRRGGVRQPQQMRHNRGRAALRRGPRTSFQSNNETVYTPFFKQNCFTFLLVSHYAIIFKRDLIKISEQNQCREFEYGSMYQCFFCQYKTKDEHEDEDQDEGNTLFNHPLSYRVSQTGSFLMEGYFLNFHFTGTICLFT